MHSLKLQNLELLARAADAASHLAGYLWNLRRKCVTRCGRRHQQE